MSKSANERNATQRVEAFLGGLSAGGDFQAAMNMWEKGTPNGIQGMTQDQYNMEVARLQEWLKSKKVTQPIRNYEILGAEVVVAEEGADLAVVVVSCSIDGKSVGIRSVRNQPLEWAE
jgi:dsRNA-specific ribonuclease